MSGSFINGRYSSFEEYLGQMKGWDADIRKLDRGRFSGDLSIIQSDPVQICRFIFDGVIDRNGSTPKGYVCFILPGDFKQNYNWFHKELDSTYMGIFPRSCELDMLSGDNFHTIGINVHESHLMKLIDSYQFKGVKMLLDHSEKLFRFPANELLQLSRYIHSLISTIQTDSKALTDPKFWYKVQYHLPFSILELIEKGQNVTVTDKANKRNRVLSCSLSYINQNISKKITTSALARESNVSIRTVEEIFKSRYGLTPLAYINRTKLNLIRNQLMKSNNMDSIATLTNRFGIKHQGQFSADYFNLFEELPSQTRKRINHLL